MNSWDGVALQVVGSAGCEPQLSAVDRRHHASAELAVEHPDADGTGSLREPDGCLMA
jgi:hypothetical protein